MSSRYFSKIYHLGAWLEPWNHHHHQPKKIATSVQPPKKTSTNPQTCAASMEGSPLCNKAVAHIHRLGCKLQWRKGDAWGSCPGWVKGFLVAKTLPHKPPKRSTKPQETGSKTPEPTNRDAAWGEKKEKCHQTSFPLPQKKKKDHQLLGPESVTQPTPKKLISKDVCFLSGDSPFSQPFCAKRMLWLSHHWKIFSSWIHLKNASSQTNWLKLPPKTNISAVYKSFYGPTLLILPESGCKFEERKWRNAETETLFRS